MSAPMPPARRSPTEVGVRIAAGGGAPGASALGGQSGIDRNPASRLVWADNLKVLLITLIIALHGALSYSATLKVWTYSPFREVTLHPVTEGVLFVIVTPIGFLTIPLLFLVAPQGLWSAKVCAGL